MNISWSTDKKLSLIQYGYGGGQLSLTSAADKHRSNDEDDDNRLGVCGCVFGGNELVCIKYTPQCSHQTLSRI